MGQKGQRSTGVGFGSVCQSSKQAGLLRRVLDRTGSVPMPPVAFGRQSSGRRSPNDFLKERKDRKDR